MTAEHVPAQPDGAENGPAAPVSGGRRAGWWRGRARLGPRTHLNEAVFDRMMDAARTTDTVTACCAYAGIPYHRHRDWYERGSRYLEAVDEGADLDAFTENDELYAVYVVCYDEARAEGRMLAVATIRDVMHPDVGKPSDRLKAAVYMLEHEDPQKWGRRTSVELTGKDGGPLQMDVAARHERLAASVLRHRDLAAIEATSREVAAGSVDAPGTSGGPSSAATGAPSGETPTGTSEGDAPDAARPGPASSDDSGADQIPAASPNEPNPHPVDNPVGIDYDHWAVGLGFTPEYLEGP